MTNLENYNKAFLETFGITEDKLPEMRFSTSVEWDSVAHMQLIAMLESAFDIMFEMDDIVDLSSYNKGKEILTKYNVLFE